MAGVEVLCPGCQNTVEVVTNAYSLIHNADPEKYQWGEILEILPPDPKTSEDTIRRNIQLHYEILPEEIHLARFRSELSACRIFN